MSENTPIDAAAEPVTDRVHEGSWSANLEGPAHAADREVVVTQALDAIEHTASGAQVNLVTHGEHGHPATYLYETLAEVYGDTIEWTFVKRCGCGGYVTRVRV